MMPAGKYYIGDLCYVLHDRWDEFCNITLTKETVLDGEFKFQDGTPFASYNTMWGDGLYEDENGNEYGVDAGLIGCVPVDAIAEEERKNLDLGNIFEFTQPFHTSGTNRKARKGVITFGDVRIDTDPDLDDENE